MFPDSVSLSAVNVTVLTGSELSTNTTVSLCHTLPPRPSSICIEPTARVSSVVDITHLPEASSYLKIELLDKPVVFTSVKSATAFAPQTPLSLCTTVVVLFQSALTAIIFTTSSATSLISAVSSHVSLKELTVVLTESQLACPAATIDSVFVHPALPVSTVDLVESHPPLVAITLTRSALLAKLSTEAVSQLTAPASTVDFVESQPVYFGVTISSVASQPPVAEKMTVISSFKLSNMIPSTRTSLPSTVPSTNTLLICKSFHF